MVKIMSNEDSEADGSGANYLECKGQKGIFNLNLGVHIDFSYLAKWSKRCDSHLISPVKIFSKDKNKMLSQRIIFEKINLKSGRTPQWIEIK